MGAVATEEKQALADELAEARALIEQGAYEAALDVLTTAREIAQEQSDREALSEIRGLARSVWRRAPRGSEAAERADRLARVVVQDVTQVGWSRSGQAGVEAAESDRLFCEAEQAFGRGEFFLVADLLHELRANAERGGDSGRLALADRLSERVRSGLDGLDLDAFDRTLASGKVQLGRDTGRPRGLGLWTLIVLVGWLSTSLIVAEVSYSSDNWLFSEGEYVVLHLLVFGVVALGVWLVGFFVWLARRHRARAEGRARTDAR